MMKISFVIPCYYSEKTLSGVVDEIIQTVKRINYDYEIILVNDGSLDGTYKLIKKIANENSNIKGINFAKNFGQHSALMAGLKKASGDYVVCLDDDGQTPADEVEVLINKIEEGYDVVYASYEHKQHNAFRNFGSYINDLMTRMMLGKPNDLMLTSYFIIRKYIVDEIVKYEQCYPFVDGLILRATKNIANVSVNHRKREIGKSGYSFAKLFSLWMNGFTSFSIKPLRVATYIGSITAVAGFIYMIINIVKALVFKDVPEGWTSLITITLFMDGIILVVLGLIGEYVGRIFMCNNVTPQYVIKEETGNEKE